MMRMLQKKYIGLALLLLAAATSSPKKPNVILSVRETAFLMIVYMSMQK